MADILFKNDISRFTLFPLKSEAIFEAYKNARDVFWVPNEIDITVAEINEFNSMKPAEKKIILNILAFFASADNIVLNNLMTNFSNDVTLTEATMFFSFQASIESIHSEMYALLIDAYCENNEQKMQIFNSIENNNIVQLKTNFAIKYLESKQPFTERAVAFACIEGILFSSSFAFIYYFKQKNMLPALTLSNEFISRDEKMHSDFAILLVNLFDEYNSDDELNRTRPSNSTILEIIKEAVNIETVFVKECLDTDLIGLSCNDMIQYVQFVADTILIQLKCEKHYMVNNPLDYMNAMSLEQRTNFFESRSSQYQKADNITEFCNSDNVDF